MALVYSMCEFILASKETLIYDFFRSFDDR